MLTLEEIFPRSRSAHQGMGTGTLMRQLVAGFAFEELGVDRRECGYIVGKHASAVVSRQVGYVATAAIGSCISRGTARSELTSRE